jgi:hypothetical protein
MEKRKYTTDGGPSVEDQAQDNLTGCQSNEVKKKARN